MGGQIGDVDGDPGLHASSSGHPFGQNQPIRVIATGIDPQTTAQGEKIDQMSRMAVAMAANSGQIELSGEGSRIWGSAVITLVMTSSRRLVARPSATGRTSGFSHS